MSPKSKSSTRTSWRIVVLYGVVICIYLVVLIAIRLNVVKASYRMFEAKKEKAALKQAISAAKVQMSFFFTPAKMETVARDTFHLEKPKPKYVVYFEDRE